MKGKKPFIFCWLKTDPKGHLEINWGIASFLIPKMLGKG